MGKEPFLYFCMLFLPFTSFDHLRSRIWMVIHLFYHGDDGSEPVAPVHHCIVDQSRSKIDLLLISSNFWSKKDLAQVWPELRWQAGHQWSEGLVTGWEAQHEGSRDWSDLQKGGQAPGICLANCMILTPEIKSHGKDRYLRYLHEIWSFSYIFLIF